MAKLRKSCTEDKKNAILMANQLLRKIGATIIIRKWHEMGSWLFIMLFEQLFKFTPEGIDTTSIDRHQEVKNCHIILDTLSKEILKTSLDHITAENIVSGKYISINNLLEIFMDLYDIVGVYQDNKLKFNKVEIDKENTEYVPIWDKYQKIVLSESKNCQNDEIKTENKQTSDYLPAWSEIPRPRGKIILNEKDQTTESVLLSKNQKSSCNDKSRTEKDIYDLTRSLEDRISLLRQNVDKSEPFTFSSVESLQELKTVLDTKKFYSDKVNDSTNTSLMSLVNTERSENFAFKSPKSCKISDIDESNLIYLPNIQEKPESPNSKFQYDHFEQLKNTKSSILNDDVSIKSIQNTGASKTLQRLEDILKKMEKIKENGETMSVCDQINILKQLYDKELKDYLKEKETNEQTVMNTNKINVNIPHKTESNQKTIPRDNETTTSDEVNNIQNDKNAPAVGDVLNWIRTNVPSFKISKETENLLEKKNMQHQQHVQNVLSNNKNKIIKKKKIMEAYNQYEKLFEKAEQANQYKKQKKNLLESKRFNVKMRNSGDKIRQNNAAARKHFNNFKSELKKCKMSKENNEEQMILNLFSECVEMQREKLRGIRKRNVYLQKKELCEIDNTIKSIENFYKDKISIINENFNLKENAAKFNKIDYQKNLEKLKNDYRKMLLKDINNMDNDKFNYYNTNSNKLYREKDSNFVKNRMNILNYKR